ncbi:uncharacterized protein TNIN_308781 [Trichonephila inaurata madagascariensis]|uniref:Uncharacterized protein n=1 Tax=Trichonephila inaurata madagascariensis TaxID=2747483 RepID=A0A8X6X9D5_9ARAC|nr:uncharacterized protein TNIN_308781 [Trichonephila inaurata madagascariensis]
MPSCFSVLLGEGKEIWSDITFCSVEELDSWLFHQVLMSRTRKFISNIPVPPNITHAIAFEYAGNIVNANIVSPKTQLDFFCIKRFPPLKPEDEKGENE